MFLLTKLQLKSKDVHKRQQAVIKLGSSGDKRVVNALIGALEDSAPIVRQTSAQFLGRIGDPRSVEPLISTLKDPIDSVRRAAVEALGNIGDPRAIEPLICVLSQLIGARGALVKIGEPAIESLKMALKSPDKRAVAEAAETLRLLGWQPIDNRQRAILAVQNQQWDDAARLGEVSVAPLLEIFRVSDEYLKSLPLHYKTDYDHKFEAAKKTLTKIGSPAEKSLVSALWDENNNVRKAVAEVLKSLNWQPKDDAQRVQYAVISGKRGNLIRELGIKAIEPLTALIKHDARSVRQEVANILGSIKDESVIEPLITLSKGSSPFVQREAAEALGRVGNPRGIKPLKFLTEQSEEFVVLAATRALGEIGDPNAFDALLKVLEYSDKKVRNEAITALGKIKDPRAVRPLITLTKDADIAQCTVWSIHNLLKNNVSNITTDDLEELAKLEDVIQNQYVFGSLVGDLDGYKIQGVNPVDCTQLRQLAKQELDRRGTNE